MNESVTRPDDTTSQVDLIWQRRVDALACGECSEEDFIAELSSLRQTGADSAWNVVALLDQRYRRGQLPTALFRSIEAKIARRELGALEYGTTIELDAVRSPPAAAREISPADTVDILTVDYPVQMEPAAGAAAPSAPDDSVLRDRYVVERRLGSGGMGTVFKAVDRYRCDLPQPNRIVAIKFLHETAGHPEVVSKLRREFYCAQALSHPNIVKVYELDRDDDVEFFTMEFLEGELLSSVIEKLDPIPLSRSRAWAIILEVAAGIAHAHSRNVVHGDLKPQNIMITSSGETRILDFGASSAEIAQKSTSSAMTPAYASCELLAGQGADARDDLFALACLSYELLAGQHPFQRRRSTVARDLGLIAPRPRGLTRQQWLTLKQGLAWRREDRSMSVGDWIRRLRPASTAAQRAKSWWGIIAVAVLIAGVALAALYNRQMFEKKNSGDAAGSTTAAQVPIAPGSAAPDSSGAAVQSPPVAEALAAPPRPRPRNARPGSGAAPVNARIDNVSITAGYYKIGAHKNFAEVHVRRSNGSGGDTTFAWWTEPGTALPGTDYVAQARTIQLLSEQSQMASLFVRLLPNVARKHHVVFYVVIGEPGKGASLGRVTRAQVVLPAQ
jgi:tRNA A-37 threonylcarbamoyl transferase component Bud32